jgi:kynurenine formamidase
VDYILGKGVKCIGTDAPSMGSVNPVEATMTHWAAASREGVFVEFLTNVGALPPNGRVLRVPCSEV